jgi:hypothetical protein
MAVSVIDTLKSKSSYASYREDKAKKSEDDIEAIRQHFRHLCLDNLISILQKIHDGSHEIFDDNE